MKAREKLKATLQTAGAMCDDCLTPPTGIRHRETVNRGCRELENLGELSRQLDLCPRCRKYKIVNSLKARRNTQPIVYAEIRETIARTASSIDYDKPWFWGRNVQNRIVEHLQADGWRILSGEETSIRVAGRDIVATKKGEELWVSVKGYPDKDQYKQARRWFSEALFDVVLFRDESPSVRLAIGLPAGFKTYENLIPRVSWLMTNLPLEFITVSVTGAVAVIR